MTAATDAADALRDALAAALWARLPADRAATLNDVAMAVPAALETVGYAGLADYVVAAEAALTAAGLVSTEAAAVAGTSAPLDAAVDDLDTARLEVATARAGLNTINAGLLP